MKYSFDDIRPMRSNRAKPRPVSDALHERNVPRVQIEEKKIKSTEDTAPKTAKVFSEAPQRTQKPWSDTPLHVRSKGDDHTLVIPRRPIFSRGTRVFLAWLFLFLLALCGLLFLGNNLRRATITIVPKIIAGTVDTTLTAVKSGTFPQSLPFETMTVSDTLSQTVKASESTIANEYARGTIIIYNKASTTSQKLVSGTRFQTPVGKIYKLEKAVDIPGQKKVNGVLTPGQIEATIVASEPGESYNGDPADFSLPGFKGTSKYTTIYARSKGPLSGGATGTVFTISPSDRAQALAELTKSLQEKLLNDAEKQVPQGYRFFKDATVSTITPSRAETYSSTASIQLTVEGILTAVLLPEDAFAYSVAHSLTEDIQPNISLEQPDTRALSIKIDPENTGSLTTDKTISIHLSGSTSVRFSIDTEKVRSTVIGVEKTLLPETVAPLPGVLSATLSLNPWYAKRLPDRGDRIHILTP